MDVTPPVPHTWTQEALTILSILVATAIPVIGYTLKQILNRIDEVKTDLDKKILAVKTDLDKKILAVKDDAEVKRVETRNTLLELIETKFDAIRDTLRDIKDEVKGHLPKP